MLSSLHKLKMLPLSL